MCSAEWPDDTTKILNGHRVQTVIHNVWLNDLLERELPKEINNLTEAEKEALEKWKAEQDLAMHVIALRDCDRNDLKLQQTENEEMQTQANLEKARHPLLMTITDSTKFLIFKMPNFDCLNQAFFNNEIALLGNSVRVFQALFESHVD
jgi:hypothetical protein